MTAARASSPNGVKILVADDMAAERRAARDALSEAGYEVVEADNGQQALEVYARERPDLVMLDLVMPRLTGLEACRILKAKTQNDYLPVIIVSNRNTVNSRVEGLRSGADDYLGKPYDAEELRARVEVLLRTKTLVAPRDTPSQAAETALSRIDLQGPKADLLRTRMRDEFERAKRYSDPLAMLKVSPDAAAEDPERVDALRGIVDRSIRKIDLMFRELGETFLVLLPNTHFPGALAVAERIAKDVRRDTNTVVSVGVSFFPNKDTTSLEDLTRLVDAALERARGEGGGNICLFQHQGYLYSP